MIILILVTFFVDKVTIFSGGEIFLLNVNHLLIHARLNLQSCHVTLLLGTLKTTDKYGE